MPWGRVGVVGVAGAGGLAGAGVSGAGGDAEAPHHLMLSFTPPVQEAVTVWPVKP
jgi:hypothetical protein